MKRTASAILALVLVIGVGYTPTSSAENGRNGAFFGGLAAGLIGGAIIGSALSQRQQTEIGGVFEDEAYVGYESRWSSYYNSSFRVVDQGYYCDQYGRTYRNVSCRRVVSLDYYRRVIPDSERVYCADLSDRYPGYTVQARWFAVQPTMMVPMQPPQPRYYPSRPRERYYDNYDDDDYYEYNQRPRINFWFSGAVR